MSVTLVLEDCWFCASEKKKERRPIEIGWNGGLVGIDLRDGEDETRIILLPEEFDEILAHLKEQGYPFEDEKEPTDIGKFISLDTVGGAEKVIKVEEILELYQQSGSCVVCYLERHDVPSHVSVTEESYQLAKKVLLAL